MANPGNIFLWSNALKTGVAITSFRQFLKLPNCNHIAQSIIKLEACGEILLVVTKIAAMTL